VGAEWGRRRPLSHCELLESCRLKEKIPTLEQNSFKRVIVAKLHNEILGKYTNTRYTRKLYIFLHSQSLCCSVKPKLIAVFTTKNLSNHRSLITLQTWHQPHMEGLSNTGELSRSTNVRLGYWHHTSLRQGVVIISTSFWVNKTPIVVAVALKDDILTTVVFQNTQVVWKLSQTRHRTWLKKNRPKMLRYVVDSNTIDAVTKGIKPTRV